MKTRFNTFDIICIVTELQKYVGMRVNNVYDIDNKTYLIKLQRTEEKAIILLESGNRIHSTAFEWPKNSAPSGFSMKMRKHIKNKRLESLTQLGTDRIIDLQFGSGEAAYHVILELYDRGNVILTDYAMKILYILRPHTEGEQVKFAVREVYPQNRAREISAISRDDLIAILNKGKSGDQLKKILVSNLEYGPAVIEHVLVGQGFNNSTKLGKNFDINNDIDKLIQALAEADSVLQKAKEGLCKGYIIQKKEERPTANESDPGYFLSNQEFHPYLFRQHENAPYQEFDSFNGAVDEFFSSVESQKIDLKAVQQEREALKKLENVKKDHTVRIAALTKTQEVDKQKAELIMRNQKIVENAIYAIQVIIANQTSWDEIKKLVKKASDEGDYLAQFIKELKLEINHISLYLTDPYAESDDEEGEKIPPMIVDVDLSLSAYSNATRYYNQKKHAAKKQQKTLESQTKAMKSAEKKTKLVLKEVKTITNIHKARKVYWFEKFFWFISSENYLVIAGRDQQQNELIVKRYLKPQDVYVHADIHGASSIIIKNPTNLPVPPKTLNEAGTMAICYSVAWEAKVVTNAYWVWGEQVSKTAPTGEYLTTGSFMIRGKKNFLPPSHLILGLSFLFRLEDGSVERHRGERKVITTAENEFTNKYETDEGKDDEEVVISDDSEGEEKHSNEENNIEQKIDKEEESSESADEYMKFPDTKIKIQRSSNSKINILTESVLPKERNIEKDDVVFLGDGKPVHINNTQHSRRTSESKNEIQIQKNEKKSKEDQSKQQMKRGQKSKLKKIKEKYKDQDEEERQLRMQILQSSGSLKETKKDKKNKDAGKNQQKKQILQQPRQPQIKKEADDDEDEVVVQADVDMIDALTGVPTAEDELLFAVPVIAPYNTLTNYKFKVKLTPGTGKKGKAAKTAVAMFLKDRTITQRERDLLKAVKDDQLARNFPGKVKLSAPKLQALKK